MLKSRACFSFFFPPPSYPSSKSGIAAWEQVLPFSITQTESFQSPFLPGSLISVGGGIAAGRGRNMGRQWGESLAPELGDLPWGGEVVLVTPGGDTAWGQALLGAAGARRGAALGNASLPERRLMPALERKPKQSFPFKPRFQNKTKGEKKYVKKTL